MNLSDIYEKLGLFYLGKEVDPATGKMSEDLTLLKSKDLTTHSAIIGMTGSGKTGLGIGLIEEAVLDNIPCLIIDPKGDMGNLLLAFDDYNPKSFETWIDEGEAEKKGMSKADYALQTAHEWQKGIESWHQDADRITRFKNGADFTIYTPGSSTGIPLSALSSFDAPSAEILEDPDTYSYLLNATVTSILALIGIEADPLQSKEFLLVSNIFNHFWPKGISLSLEALIGHIATPPFEKIGVLALNSFYPQDERVKLAMLLNNIIASPTFSAWIQGDALDIQSLLYTKEAKPRVSILSLSHLSDNERMFFVTLFLNKFISWMRAQSGTSSLRAMLYMDEIFGFFPATSNPPSKNPMLLLLKQARAFGINITLSTQNPVDIDYKGLSNIGTWFIGRLQTKQDIDKVIDGLIKSDSDALDKKTLTTLLANLGKRVFILKSAHRDAIELFTTRWTLSFLRGPLSKAQIGALMKAKKENTNGARTIQAAMSTSQTASVKPMLGEKITQLYYSPSHAGDAAYEPYLLAHASVRFFDNKRGIDTLENFSYKYYLDDRLKKIQWSEHEDALPDITQYGTKSADHASFASLPSFVASQADFKTFEDAFEDYLYHERPLTLFKVPTLKLESTHGEDLTRFKIRLSQVLKEKQEEEIEKLQEVYAKKDQAIETKLRRAYEKLDKEKADVSASTTDTVLSIGMTLLDAFLGKKTIKSSTASRAGSSIRSARKLYGEKDDVGVAEQNVEMIEAERQALSDSLKGEIETIASAYNSENYAIEEFLIKPKRSDISNLQVALLWESRV